MAALRSSLAVYALYEKYIFYNSVPSIIRNGFYRTHSLSYLPVFASSLELSSYKSNLILVKIKANVFIKIQNSPGIRLTERKDCFQYTA